MHKDDFNRVTFHSKSDLVNGFYLSKIEKLLRNETRHNYTDINDVLELYNVKLYIDQEVFLRSWTEEDISLFQKKVNEYGKIVGYFISTVNDENFIKLYENTLHGYIPSFWQLICNHRAYKRISKENFNDILTKEPHTIDIILNYESLVNYFGKEIRTFLLNYSKSAEILLSNYEVHDDGRRYKMHFPKTLSINDKEQIVSKYLDSESANYNYIKLIKDVGKSSEFVLSDKTRLKAKRLYKSRTEEFFANNNGIRYGVSVGFREGQRNLKEISFDKHHTLNCIYSIDYIKDYQDSFLLFQNFKFLFEYLDEQNRIALLSKKSQFGLLDRLFGLRSKNEYLIDGTFSLSEMTSHAQIFGYNTTLKNLNISIENILHYVFTKAFREYYHFAENARITIPSASSYLEKLRVLAPEFESVLKQFKLFVEDRRIDFELLQISSSPTKINDIPSLNKNKYIYVNEKNKEAKAYSNLFFSDQTLLTYIEPFKESGYTSFFDLLANEQVAFDSYEDHQRPELNYLIDQGYIIIDSNGFIEITNYTRLLILKDLHDNEFASFYHYPSTFQKEVHQMVEENIVCFGSTLFSKSEQSYFNYYLNKSEFTNGLDLRNSYLHGTQADPDEVQKHEYAYLAYLKLFALALLKMDDDLYIWKILTNSRDE